MFPGTVGSNTSQEMVAEGVTVEDVLAVQAKWAAGIATISATHKAGGDFVAVATKFAGEMYTYGEKDVLFKPTKATENQFRPTPESAM